jgi:hypothetical protein
MKRLAFIAALTALAFISVVLALFAFLTIADSISFWCEIHFSPYWLHENGENNALPIIPFCLLFASIGWLSAHILWCELGLDWKLPPRRAKSAAAPEGKTGNWIPSTYGEQNIRKLHFSAFIAFTIVVFMSCLSTIVTFFMFYKRFSLINIIAVVVGWILAHRLWRTWKRTALRPPTSAEAEIRGIL